MKCKIIFLLGLLSILVTSCEKITNVNVVDGETTGTLNYRLNDDSGKGLAGVRVSVYDADTYFHVSALNPDALVATIRTNQEGTATFSGLLPKNYLVTTDSSVINTVRYYTNDFVQIVAGNEKKKIINVSEFSGFLNIRLISNNDNTTPLKNMGIIAYPANDFQLNSGNAASFVKTAALRGITDENGYASIKVPSDINFDLLVYNLSNGNLSYGYGFYRVGKGEQNRISLYTSGL